MDYHEQRTPTALPKPPPKRREQFRQIARSFFAAGLAILLLMLLALGFFPVAPDRPTGPSAEVGEQRGRCERKAGTRSLEPQTHTVPPGRSIQITLDRAQPGDTVLVSPGVYGESLRIEIDALTLRGLPHEGQRPVLEGMGRLENAIVACADGLTLEGIELRNFTGNGVLVQDVDRATIRDVFANRVVGYGIFALGSQRVTVERSAASGSSRSGIFVSQSQDVVVRGNEVFANVSGVGVANSSNVLVEANHAHDNSAGIQVLLLPDLQAKRANGVLLRDNRVTNNGLDNFAPEDELLSRLKTGIGILVAAADGTQISGNEIRGNRSVGVAVTGLAWLFPERAGFDVGTVPESTWVHDNTFKDNGGDPDPVLAAMRLAGADLVWDASGWDNLWSEAGATRSPPLLPGPGMPAFLRRGLWRVLVIVRQLS